MVHSSLVRNVALIIWCTSIFLEVLVLFRGIIARVTAKYPFFYAFVVGTLVVNSLLLYAYVRANNFYYTFYWYGEFLTLVLACGIILEIFRHVLSPYPGAARLARIIAIITFGVILCSSGVYPLLARLGSVSSTVEDLERDLRCVQAIFLLSILTLISYYRIPIGRNMKGMITGYGISIGVNLMTLVIYSYTQGRYATILSTVGQLGYTVPNVIWAAALWSYAPNPENKAARIEEDYEELARRTQATMDTLRGYLGKAVRP